MSNAQALIMLLGAEIDEYARDVEGLDFEHDELELMFSRMHVKVGTGRDEPGAPQREPVVVRRTVALDLHVPRPGHRCAGRIPTLGEARRFGACPKGSPNGVSCRARRCFGSGQSIPTKPVI